MEPFDNQELTDHELDGMLREWKTPPVPGQMRTGVFPERAVPWWRRSIHIPLPVAACLALVLAFGGWRIATPTPARVIVKTERVEVPVVSERTVTQIVYRDRPPAMHGLTFHELQPVAALRSRIIRRGNVEN